MCGLRVAKGAITPCYIHRIGQKKPIAQSLTRRLLLLSKLLLLEVIILKRIYWRYCNK